MKAKVSCRAKVNRCSFDYFLSLKLRFIERFPLQMVSELVLLINMWFLGLKTGWKWSETDLKIRGRNCPVFQFSAGSVLALSGETKNNLEKRIPPLDYADWDGSERSGGRQRVGTSAWHVKARRQESGDGVFRQNVAGDDTDPAVLSDFIFGQCSESWMILPLEVWVPGAIFMLLWLLLILGWIVIVLKWWIQFSRYLRTFRCGLLGIIFFAFYYCS